MGSTTPTPTGRELLRDGDIGGDSVRSGAGERSREHPVERSAVDAEPSSDGGLRYAGADEVACFGDLLVGEFAGAAFVLAGGLGDANALALAFADEGALELGECAEEVEHESADGVVGVAAVGLLFLHELDRCALRGDLVDDVAQVPKGAGKPVHGRDSDGVAVTDVADTVGQGEAVGGCAAGDLLLEHSAVDVADGLELLIEVLIDRAHPDVGDDLRL